MNAESMRGQMDAHMALLDKKLKELLDRVDVEELSAKQCLDGAAKLIALSQRYMYLQLQFQVESPEGRQEMWNSANMKELMRAMRGEEPLSEQKVVEG